MKKKTNENLRNKYLLIALSILCAVLIAVSFFESSLVSPVKEITGFFITPVQKESAASAPGFPA